MQTSRPALPLWLTPFQLGDHGDTRSIVSVLIPIDVMHPLLKGGHAGPSLVLCGLVPVQTSRPSPTILRIRWPVIQVHGHMVDDKAMPDFQRRGQLPWLGSRLTPLPSRLRNDSALSDPNLITSHT